jgi:hypothetical protein
MAQLNTTCEVVNNVFGFCIWLLLRATNEELLGFLIDFLHRRCWLILAQG